MSFQALQQMKFKMKIVSCDSQRIFEKFEHFLYAITFCSILLVLEQIWEIFHIKKNEDEQQQQQQISRSNNLLGNQILVQS